MRLDVSYLPRLNSADIALAFSKVDDETLLCLLISYGFLSRGIDWLYDWDFRPVTPHLKLALESIPEVRLRKVISSLPSRGEWTVIHLAHSEAKLRKVVEWIYAAKDPERPVAIEMRDLANASDQANRQVSTSIKHLQRCDDRALQMFYSTFLSNTVWATFCRGLVAEDQALIDRMRRNMTEGARAVFDIEMTWAKGASAASVVEAKLELMALLTALAQAGKIIIQD